MNKLIVDRCNQKKQPRFHGHGNEVGQNETKQKMSGSYRFPTADKVVLCLFVCLFACFVIYAMKSCGFSCGGRKKFLVSFSCAFVKLSISKGVSWSFFVFLPCSTTRVFLQSACGRVVSLAWRHYRGFPRDLTG